MSKNKFYAALAYIANEQNTKNPCIIFDEKTFENDNLRPTINGGYLINIFDFRELEDDFGNVENVCTLSYERNGFLFQTDYCFGINDEYDEFLYETAYQYCIGENEQTSEEFLDFVSLTDVLGY